MVSSHAPSRHIWRALAIGVIAAAACGLAGSGQGARVLDVRAPAPARLAASSGGEVLPSSGESFTSVFSDRLPDLDGAGWGRCAEPITWTLATTGGDPESTERFMSALQGAFGQWAAVTGLTFRFAGTTPVLYDPNAFTAQRLDGSKASSRSIDIVLVGAGHDPNLSESIPGRGSPVSVWPRSREIDRGLAALYLPALERMDERQVRALFVHEIGHVLGLGHSVDGRNVMHPVIGRVWRLGPGDRAGARTLAKPCRASR